MLSRMCNFYPRPPRGGRLIYQATTEDDRKFLSTPSARRATLSNRLWLGRLFISIHSLREEGDAYEPFHLREKIEISIHALREEGDKGRRSRITGQKDFYPRPPRGGRLEHDLLVRIVQKFLSTPSARRATPARFSRGKLLS